MEQITNLIRKLATDVECQVIPALCCWSDLLGFGRMVSQNNWHPDEKTWGAIVERLLNVQAFCVQSLEPSAEYSFVSNDGFIRNLDLAVEPGHIQFFSYWFRSLIWYHISVNSYEKSRGYAGMRTVVAGGERLLHNWDKFTTADLYLDFEGREKGPGSSYFEADKNIIMENPLPLQMNTAFSKAYILDDGGSKQGLPGNKFYIEQSVFDVIQKYAEQYQDHCDLHIWKEENDRMLFWIPKKNYKHLFHLGFELSRPIPFNYKGVETNVYQVYKFYPWDEDPQEFHISLYEDNIYYLTRDRLKMSYPSTKVTFRYPDGPRIAKVVFKEVESLVKTSNNQNQ